MTAISVKLSDNRAIYLRDVDLRAALPKKPKLIAELAILQAGRGEALIYGGKNPLLVKTPRGMAALERLLDRLDGNMATEDLLRSDIDGDDGATFDLVVALTRAGLVVDGEERADRNPTGDFLARYSTAAGRNKNSRQAQDRITSAVVGFGVSGLEPRPVARALAACGFSQVDLFDPANQGDLTDSRRVSFALFVINGDGEELRPFILAAHANKTPYLVSRIGRDSSQVGSLVIPDITAGFDCIDSILDPPAGRARPERAEFWAAHAAQLFVAEIACLVGARCNQVSQYAFEAGAPTETHPVSAIPGSATSSIDADPLYMEDDALRTVWRHHMSVRRPPRELMGSLGHFGHFTAANVARSRNKIEPFYGADHVVLADVEMPMGTPWAGLQDKLGLESGAADLDPQGLAILLRAMAGYSNREGTTRRIAPTGGGLESPILYVLLNGVLGIEDGGYRYHGPSHRLERLDHLDWATALAAVGAGVARQCLVFNIGWLEKVRGKYGDFGYSVVHYDAGVANQFGRLICGALGVPFQEMAECDTDVISRALALRDDTFDYLPTSVSAIGASVPEKPLVELSPTFRLLERSRRPRVRPAPVRGPAPPPASCRQKASGSGSLGDLLETRRSTNAFADVATPSELIRQLVHSGLKTKRVWEREGGLVLDIWPLLLRRGGTADLPAGVYAPDGTGADWTCRREGLSYDEIASCINQLGLATAGDIIVMVGDLRDATTRYGEAGYRALLMRAGSMVAQMWLGAHAMGLGSTAAGGVLEPGLFQHAGCDGYRACPLLSLAVGVPLHAATS